MSVLTGCVLLLSEALIGFYLMDDQFREWCKGFWERIVRVVEQPLALAAICIVSGVVGLVYFSPVLAVCGLLFGVGLHRSRALEGLSVKVQIPIYAIVLAVTGFMSVTLGEKLKAEVHIPTTTEIGDYIINKLNAGAKGNGAKDETPQTPTTSKTGSPRPIPIEVSVKCAAVTLPIFVPVGGTLRMVPLIHTWRPHFALPNVTPNLSTSPMQWPADSMLALSKDVAERIAMDCEVNNHGHTNVLNLTIPFRYEFGGNTKELAVDLNPVDAGKPIHVYFVNDCPDTVTVTIPQLGKARLVGEKKVRDVEFELEPRDSGWSFTGTSFQGGWGQATCD